MQTGVWTRKRDFRAMMDDHDFPYREWWWWGGGGGGGGGQRDIQVPWKASYCERTVVG